TGKMVLLHFWTSTCGPCRVLDRDVFSQPQVSEAIERDFVPVKINADDSPALASAYRIEKVPTDILLTPQGNVVASLNCPLNANDYQMQLAGYAQQYRASNYGQGSSLNAPVQGAYAGLQI